MGDANAKVCRETVHQTTIGLHSLHENTNENGLRLFDFAASKQKMAIESTYFMHKRIHLDTWYSLDGHTFNQIGHCLIYGRHFSDVIDDMARKGTNIDSDHMLVVIKLRARICRASNTKTQQLRRFAVDRLKDRDVASRYYDELESELQGVQAQPLQRVATNTIGYTRKPANKDWFDEECAMVNKEKNAARERANQIKTRGAKKAYKLARTK
jgi:hypothetical protein